MPLSNKRRSRLHGGLSGSIVLRTDPIDADDKPEEPTVTKIEGAVTAKDINKGGWNQMHVIMKGNNFKFFINGKPSAEFTEHLPEAKRLHKGMIQLQLHDPGMIVQFKDIWLKVLK